MPREMIRETGLEAGDANDVSWSCSKASSSGHPQVRGHAESASIIPVPVANASDFADLSLMTMRAKFGGRGRGSGDSDSIPRFGHNYFVFLRFILLTYERCAGKVIVL